MHRSHHHGSQNRKHDDAYNFSNDRARRDPIERDYRESSRSHYAAAVASLSCPSPSKDDLNYFGINALNNYEPSDSEIILKMKWLDNSPRMSRLRDHRQKRLINKLEQFELWDMEQEQKQKQYEVAREQRYKNITERLKCQEFCVNLMKKRHESDLETTRELDLYSNDHLYVDALDDPRTNYHGPVSQYRKFLNDMDGKLKHLHNDMDTLNPRNRIEQAILPRIERTRILYSLDPEIIMNKGRHTYKKRSTSKEKSAHTDAIRFYYPPQQPFAKPIRKSRDSSTENSTNINTSNQNNSSSTSNRSSSADKPKLKPIINTTNQDETASIEKSAAEKKVNFNDEINYREVTTNGNNEPSSPSKVEAETAGKQE